VPHAMPVIVHKNIGLRARERRTVADAPNRRRPRNPSHRVSGAVLAADLPDVRT
jgi:hypothetical protein